MNLKNIYILIYILLINSITYSQYNIKTYNGKTITTCSGTFTCSKACSSTYYCDNENYTITFCTGDPQKRITVLFGSVMTDASIQTGDHLYIYDGATVTSPLMHDMTYNITNYTIPIIASGSCITFKFTSNNDHLLGFWNATISCESIPSVPAECNANTPTSNFCSDSPVICNMNGYCGNTSNYYTADLPGNFCEGCSMFQGSIQNNSWLSFTADTSFANLELKIFDCTNNNGLQFGVYSADNCNNFQIISDPGYTRGDVGYSTAGKTINIKVPYGSAAPLVKGKRYYFMIDGLGNDVCSYSIKAVTGVLTVKAGNDQTICYGDSAKLKASGGKSYKWSPPDGLNNPDIYNPIASPSVTTTYTVMVTDGNPGCEQTAVASVVISVVPITEIGVITDKNEICKGECLKIQLTGAEKYEWTPQVNLLNSDGSDAELCPSKTETYKIKGTTTVNDLICEQDTAFTINVNNSVALNLSRDSVICPGKFLILDAGIDSVFYLWSDSSTNKTLRVTEPGLYSVTITNGNKCFDTDSIKVINNSTPTVDLGSDTVKIKNNYYYLIDAGNWFSNYLWSDNSRNSQLKVTNTGNYAVIVTDKYGCKSSDSIYVEISISKFIFIPSAFSPNSDNLNDCFGPVTADNFYCSDYNMLVFDRWGKIVFQSDDIKQYWDGTSNGTICPEGLYICIIKYKDVTNKKIKKFNSITLLR